MKTTFFAFILIALVGLLVLAYTANSSITGQGVKITIPQETLKKVIPEKTPHGTQDYYSLNECSIFHEIYILRQELNLPTERLEIVKNICTYSDWW